MTKGRVKRIERLFLSLPSVTERTETGKRRRINETSASITRENDKSSRPSDFEILYSVGYDHLNSIRENPSDTVGTMFKDAETASCTAKNHTKKTTAKNVPLRNMPVRFFPLRYFKLKFPEQSDHLAPQRRLGKRLCHKIGRISFLHGGELFFPAFRTDKNKR